MVNAGYCTPMLHVADVERSTAFYTLLGFELIDNEGAPRCPIRWARMHCEGAALMFLRAKEALREPRPSVLFYLYTPDLQALRSQLVGQGIEVSAIAYPEHMSAGEMTLRDPDGCPIAIGHWGKAEHDAWLERLERRKTGPAVPAIPPG